MTPESAIESATVGVRVGLGVGSGVAGRGTQYQPLLPQVASSVDLTFGLREGFKFEYFFLPIPPS